MRRVSEEMGLGWMIGGLDSGDKGGWAPVSDVCLVCLVDVYVGV